MLPFRGKGRIFSLGDAKIVIYYLFIYFLEWLGGPESIKSRALIGWREVRNPTILTPINDRLRLSVSDHACTSEDFSEIFENRKYALKWY